MTVYGGVDVNDRLYNSNAFPILITVGVTLTGTTTSSADPQYQPAFSSGTGVGILAGNDSVHCNPTANGNHGTCEATLEVPKESDFLLGLGLATIITYTVPINSDAPPPGSNSTFSMNYYGQSLDITSFSATPWTGNH